MESNEIEPAIDAEMVIRIAEHYCHARRKHPRFADRLFLWGDSAEDAGETLADVRDILDWEKHRGRVLAQSLLECEIYEAIYAFASGNKAHAVEECYDAIAVLLRMVDVIEGRQKLGE